MLAKPSSFAQVIAHLNEGLFAHGVMAVISLHTEFPLVMHR
jgi:hypothetical protein